LLISTGPKAKPCDAFKRDKSGRCPAIETRMGVRVAASLNAHLFAVPDAAWLDVQPACRDPKDNKCLALALVCEADAIISGDHDLMALNPWRSIPVLRPAGFVD
jgi:uncharacterized protein